MEYTPKTGFYFAPGEVMLTVEHAATISIEELAQRIQGNFNDFRAIITQDYSELNETFLPAITIPPEAIVTLSTEDEVSRSLAFVPVSSYREKHISDDDFNVAAANQQISRLVEVAFSFLFQGKTATPFISHEVKLTSISPNWHSTGSQPARDGSGGPGARPEVVTGGGAGFQFQFDQATTPHNYVVEYIRALANKPSGAGVDVVILDTIPSRKPSVLLERYPNHPLIKSMFQSETVRIYEYDRDIAPHANGLMARLSDNKHGVGINGHNYFMRDHGLFIAGIIHSIAPSARLHLIQVLNDYGVGTTETIANGITFALNRIPWRTSPLIINCSFTIQMPLREQTIDDRIYHTHPSPELNWNQLLNDPALATVLEADVKQIFVPLFNNQALVVAAAGNDHQNGSPAPQARMPAKFPEATGVGALSQNKNPAPYSNEADAPQNDGIDTFGGDVVPVNPTAPNGPTKADSLNGILGVYTEDGTGAHNPSGWGRWAGTSFATPIIAGVLALLRADGKSNVDALAVIRNAQQEPLDKPHKFLVTQG